MEKRALIALALSFAVLMFWQHYFGLSRPVEEQAKKAPETVTTTPPPPVAKTEGAPSAPVPSLTPHTLPKDQLTQLGQKYDNWNIESALYKMSLLAPGARLNSFQLEKFRQTVDPTSPPVELVPSQASGYLPMAVDLLFHQEWQLSTRPYSSDSPKEINLSTAEQSKPVSFSTEIADRVKVTKTITLIPDSYIMDVQVRLQNLSAEPLTDQVGVSFYFQPYSAEESSYNPSQLSVYDKSGLTLHSVSDIIKKETVIKPPMSWVGYENNFFIQAIMPIDEAGFQIIPKVLDEKTGLMQLAYLSDPFSIPGGGEKVVSLRLYLGSKEIGQLSKADHNLSRAVDYGWFDIIAKPLLYALNWFYSFTHNYGIAIILITIIIKILFWPLTHKSFKSMQMMKKIQPKIAQAREKYKDNKERLNQELMNIYKTYKVNPMGGCLPMVLQIPVFFALYRMLNAAVELRHEPFMLWINDLTAPDRLSVGFTIPYVGDGLPVLTILMGASMFIQQKMTPSAGDPRQEQMMLLMPIVFTFFFINLPSGLVLYWLVNNILSIGQQYWINRHAE